MSRSSLPPSVDSYTFGCPYCGNGMIGTISTTDFEATCPKCSREKNWHEGVFKVKLFRLTGRDSKSLRRGGPKRFVLRGKGFDDEFVVPFNTTAMLSLKNGDIISLSFPRTSKGVFRKKWDSKYSESPTGLWNSTANYGWKL